jgi:hypothetical protein
MALSGSATSGGGGSIFADSATVPLADLSPDFLGSSRDEVLSGGFPDFVGGPNLTALLSGALARDGLISDLLASEGFVLDDFRATELRPVVGFFVADLALPIAS